jgi:hypothetical protein
MYDSLRSLYILNVQRRYLKSEGNKKVSFGFEHQAKRYPCYKDVSKLWHFDYEAEEKKRFSNKPPELMWDCGVLSADQVSMYLQKTFEIFNKRSGMTEEIALKYLVFHEYNVIQALYGMQSNPQDVKENFVSKMNMFSEKQESLGYMAGLELK